jgi:methylmalonyl-CoA mutase
LSDKTLALADDFGPSRREDWIAQVEKTLKGVSFEEALVSRTADGIAIQPLYTEGPVGTVRDLRPKDAHRPWDLRTATAHPDPVRANAEILKDLEQGAASVLLRLDPTGSNGVAIGSEADMARALQGVLLDLAPVVLEAGFLGPQAADWLSAVTKAAPNAPLAFHMDPLTALAQTGTSPGPIEAHLTSAASVGARLALTHAKASLMLASGRSVHEAGGSDAQELAFMAASLLSYARALTSAGMSLQEAFERIVIGVSVDGEYFTDIAKVRAARTLWGKITAACGVTAPARIEARSSNRMLTATDPWTNLLRQTSACFGAAIAGADAILLGNFTDALGLPTAFARRQTRNMQLVLMEESHLGRVADPAGGTWYLETLTDQLAKAAWSNFQAIEAAGGIVAALQSGKIAAQVEATRAQVLAAVEAKTRKILGVTVFPNADAKPVEIETANPADFACKSVPDARLPGPDTACPALTPQRLSAPFEKA